MIIDHNPEKHLHLGRKAMANLDSILKSRHITLPTKVCIVKAMVFPVVMYGCESWTIKKAGHWRIDAFKPWCWRKLLNTLDSKEIKPLHPKGDQPWVFFGRTDAKAETPILWPTHAKNWLIGKDSDAGRDWGQEEKGTTEDEMAGWHHRLNGHEFEWTLGIGDGQGGLACCNSLGCKESDMTEQLNWTELNEAVDKIAKRNVLAPENTFNSPAINMEVLTCNWDSHQWLTAPCGMYGLLTWPATRPWGPLGS